jgi:hypothetical protein
VKSTKIYIMKKDNYTDHYEMHVSKNVNIMREHIKEVYRENKFKLSSEIDEVKGLVSPIASTSSCNDHPFCYLFLNENDLGIGVVAHECLHISTTHERFINRFKMDYGLQIGEDEERLAYYLTDCVKGVYNVLYENKHIKEDRRIKE